MEKEVKKVAPKASAAKPAAAKPAATPKAKKPAKERVYFNRLHEKYHKEIVPSLVEKYGNIMAVPRIEKIILNMGLGDVKDDTKKFTAAVDELGQITGQKAVITKAKKSISNFKLREGQRIGAKVTLRGRKMYLFMDKLISVAFPRVRDFSGLNPKSFDQFGNYALGIKEQLVFPEIDYDKVEKIRGFDIAVVTTAENKEDSLELLTLMGFPFRKK
ncbi:MAG: 50S ribosomal protein L5 [Firmicutes bacterium]|nr:50S ribosomal protein L5 [Bacillota bacterium]